MRMLVDLTIACVRLNIPAQSPPDCPLPVVNTQVEGIDGFATNDLVVAHPTRPGLWKLYGRQDDQIVLSNGEKVRSGPSVLLTCVSPMGFRQTRFLSVNHCTVVRITRR